MTITPAQQPHDTPTGEQPLHRAGATPLTRTQRILIGIVIGAVLVIALLGFIGSYGAVTQLAERKGFGSFSHAFPVAVDAGIIAFLALDLLLTWLRIPFPLLRQFAWGLTGATIAFNAAVAWPDPIGVGMHAVIPVLFVVAVEAARHAVGRIADITADRHIESPPLSRWFHAPFGTYRIWRRQHLWQLKSYEDVIRLERDRIKYRQKLVATYGWNWRRRALSHELLALRFAKLGTPIADSLAEHHAGVTAEAELVRVPSLDAPQVHEPSANQVPNPVRELPANPEPRTTTTEVHEPAPKPRKANPRTSEPANLGDRAANKQNQIDQVLNLMTELGYDAVKLAVVMDRTGMTKTTAYHRLNDARTEWTKRNAA